MDARKRPRPTILDTTDLSAVPDIAKVWRTAQKKFEYPKPSKATVSLTVPAGLAYLAGHIAKTHGMNRNKFLATLLTEDLYDAYLRVYRHFNPPKPIRKRSNSAPKPRPDAQGEDNQIPFDN